MDIERKAFADTVLMTARGRIDHTSADALSDAVMPEVEALAGHDGLLILHLGGVNYMSSVGLRVLMLAAKHTRKHGGRIVVAAPTDTLREILEISRFNLIFDIYDSIDEAFAAASSEARAAHDAGR